mgnify:CR=1 FL=1
MEKVSVILPSYNERDNIVGAVARIEETLGDRLLEVIVVDDDSPDRTAPNFHLYSSSANPGFHGGEHTRLARC